MKIAICGKMGTGKTYLADYIAKKYGFIKTSFAKRLKTLAEELFDMTHKDRGLLINFATKMREIDSRVWIKAMFRDIKNVDNVVLDDLRLNNEYITLKESGWFIIKIDINENERISRLKQKYGEYYEEHRECFNSITENDVIDLDDSHFDMTITNDNSDEMLEKINNIIRNEIMQKRSARADERRGYIFDI